MDEDFEELWASFMSLSAFSLPWMLQWSGIHIKVMRISTDWATDKLL